MCIRDRLEVSRRGLVAAVTGMFYGSVAADHKITVAELARKEAADFTKLTGEREQARESAHADVVKAQLVEQQRQRDLEAVSYTHLDVYKRQVFSRGGGGWVEMCAWAWNCAPVSSMKSGL